MLTFLVGMPGSGKTYWMRKLSKALQQEGLDLDALIEENSGKTIPELFARSESFFRQKEQESLNQILTSKHKHLIVATGGGAPGYRDNMLQMKASGCVIYIDASLSTLENNLIDTWNPRPMFAGKSREQLRLKLEELLASRKEIYEQADIIVNAESISLSNFAALINRFDYSIKIKSV